MPYTLKAYEEAGADLRCYMSPCTGKTLPCKALRTAREKMEAAQPALICITGGTGFIGHNTTIVALRAGYRVRIISRSHDKAERALEAIPESFRHQLDFAIVRDMLSFENMTEALVDATYVFHIASPMPGNEGDLRNGYLNPAVKGTLTVLAAARLQATIKAVVLTSSVAALVEPTAWLSSHFMARPYAVGPDLDLLDLVGPTFIDGPMLRYSISKIAALQAAREFLARENPVYKLISLHPSTVIGRDLMQTSATTPCWSNGLLVHALTVAPTVPAFFVDVEDVARAHLLAIQSSTVTSGEEFILLAPLTSWRMLATRTKQAFPNAHVVLPSTKCDGWNWAADTQNTEQKLGISWQDVEVTVAKVMKQQARLTARELSERGTTA